MVSAGCGREQQRKDWRFCFFGGSLSAVWIPNAKAGLSYGIESGLLGGETQGSIIYGIPAIFRLGWHPGFVKKETIDIFALLKTGWAFGIWNSYIDNDTSPNGIIGGFNFGGRYFMTPLVDVYAELGYTYYGLARSSNHPTGFETITMLVKIESFNTVSTDLEIVLERIEAICPVLSMLDKGVKIQ